MRLVKDIKELKIGNYVKEIFEDNMVIGMVIEIWYDLNMADIQITYSNKELSIMGIRSPYPIFIYIDENVEWKVYKLTKDEAMVEAI